MQFQNIHELVAKLKENSDIQVETTTLGKFLGAKSDRIAMSLGKEFLSRPVLVSNSVDSLQIIDLMSGFVVTLKNFEDVLPKLINLYSSPNFNKPKESTTMEEGEKPCRIPEATVIKTEFSADLAELNKQMQRPDRLENKILLVKKTLSVLETQKPRCNDGELEKICKAQQKLENLVKHTESRRLAPGQIPSVYEIAIWSWVS
ncbi:MAG: hypothetical protein JXB14_02295 [Candidatus Altiarchaeota archaeon]|nr:hypothetical protein [Candidatus Altiarchaeota archaeon]